MNRPDEYISKILLEWIELPNLDRALHDVQKSMKSNADLVRLRAAVFRAKGSSPAP